MARLTKTILAELVDCEPRKARITLKETDPEIAESVEVKDEVIEGKIETTDPAFSRISSFKGHLERSLRFKNTPLSSKTVTRLASISLNIMTKSRLLGLSGCPRPENTIDPEDHVDFYGFVIIVVDDDAGGDECEDGLKPQVLEMRYTGEDCAASNNSQDPKKTSCNGDPNFDSKVFIRAIDKKDPYDPKANVWFEGTVELKDTFKDTFEIDATNAGKDELKAETWVFIYDFLGDTLLQKISFHTSCSQPLAVNDQFGSLILEDIEFVLK